MRIIDWGVAPQNLTVGGTTGKFTNPMARQDVVTGTTLYEYRCAGASWIKQGGSGVVATAGTAGELFVPAGVAVYLSPKAGAYVAAIQSGSGGIASLALTRAV